MGLPAIFEKGLKPNGRNNVIGAAIYTCQVGACFRFKVFCGLLYIVGELDREIERMWRRLTLFRRKGHVGVKMPVIPGFDTPSVKKNMFFVLENSAELNAGVNYAFAKIGL